MTPPPRDKDGYLLTPVTESDLHIVPSSPTLILVSEKVLYSNPVEASQTTVVDFVYKLQERIGYALASIIRSDLTKLLLRTIVFPFLSGALSGWTTHLRRRFLWRHHLPRKSSTSQVAVASPWVRTITPILVAGANH